MNAANFTFQETTLPDSPHSSPERKASFPFDKTFLIVGLGLIGGSYAMALHRRGVRVTAIDRDPEAIRYALEQGIIEEGGLPGDTRLLREAGIVILGMYPSAMIEWVKEYQAYLTPGVWITDVSGVKRAILYPIQEMLRPDLEFIASHPMAGREVGGVQNSSDRLFGDANFIVTPTARNTPAAVDFAKELGRVLGFSQISVLTPEDHDKMIGYLSQLTHAIAVSLMVANDNPHLVKYTGDSFRDLTRIAKINEVLWSELFRLNRDILVPEIDLFIDTLEALKEKLSSGDEEGLKQMFRQSTERRKQFDRP